MELQTCSLFWAVSLCQSCASNAWQGRVWFAHMETHYCIQWLPILFSSSERRGLCYPGPKMTDTVALESLRNTEGDFFCQIWEAEVSLTTSGPILVSHGLEASRRLMAHLLSSLSLRGILRSAGQPTVGQCRPERKIKKKSNGLF